MLSVCLDFVAFFGKELKKRQEKAFPASKQMFTFRLDNTLKSKWKTKIETH